MIIETGRLAIRPWRAGDVSHYEFLSKDVGYNCFAPPGVYLVRDEAEALKKIEDRISVFERHGIGKFPVFLKGTDRCIGTCGFGYCDIDGAQEPELGYRLALAYWGKGYATEAAGALLEYAFGELGKQRVFAFAVKQNPASLKVIGKLGFQYRSGLVHAGLDHDLFVMTREDFRTARSPA